MHYKSAEVDSRPAIFPLSDPLTRQLARLSVSVWVWTVGTERRGQIQKAYALPAAKFQVLFYFIFLFIF